MSDSQNSNKPLVSVVVITHPAYQHLLPEALKSLPQSNLLEVVVHENPDQTLAKACNQAINKAQGKYIVRLDADDYIDDRLIRIEAEYLEDRPEVDCVWCDYWKKYEERIEYAPQETLEHAGGAMFRREAWELLGGFDESLEYQEAFDFWLRFRKANFKAERIPVPLYYYRQHPGSMSTNIEAKMATRRAILERHA